MFSGRHNALKRLTQNGHFGYNSSIVDKAGGRMSSTLIRRIERAAADRLRELDLTSMSEFDSEDIAAIARRSRTEFTVVVDVLAAELMA